MSNTKCNFLCRMADFLGYNSDDLIGKSLYEYHHAMDSDSICSTFKCCKYFIYFSIFCTQMFVHSLTKKKGTLKYLYFKDLYADCLV